MKLALTAVLVLMCGGVAFAVVGGGDVTMKNKGGAVLFSHANHADAAGLKCSACHAKLFKNGKQHKAVSMKDMEKGKSCGACHNGKAAFGLKYNCKSCHQQ